MIQQPLALLAFMFGVVAFSRWLEDRVALIKKLSSAVVCTLLGIALGNLGVMAQAGPVHAAIGDYAVPYSIALTILASSLRDFRAAGGALLACFCLASLGSMAGSFVASWLFGGSLGPETWKLAGMFTGAFIGGGINFVAIGGALETSPSLFSAALVVDNLSTVPFILAQIALFRLLSPFFKQPEQALDSGTPTGEDPFRYWTVAEISIANLAVLAALPLVFIVAGRELGALVPSVPSVLWITTLSIAVAQIPAVQRLKGAPVIAYLALHLFFLSIGSSARLADVVTSGPILLVYMVVILVVHVVVAYGLAWLTGLRLADITIASQATVGGPGSALALGMAMRWTSLVTPGIILGILGYAVGNYLGFLSSYLVRTWL